MNGRSKFDADAVRRAAADWWAKQRGPDAETSRAAFEAWRSADPAHTHAYEDLLGTWEQSRLLAGTKTGERRDLSRATMFERRPVVAWGAVGIAAVVIAALTSIALRAPASIPATATPAVVAYASAPGALRLLHLADGSRVTLDKQSRLRVAISAGQRRLWLDAGRARFDVFHDGTRPFVVSANGAVIRARGTIFDVDVTRAGARVLLLRGSVEVRQTGDQHRSARLLLPGQQLSIAADHDLPAAERASPGAAEWPSQMISLGETPLADAVAAFNRHNRQKISLADADTGSELVSGAFMTGDPEGFARATAIAFDLDLQRAANGDLILARKSRETSLPKKIIGG